MDIENSDYGLNKLTNKGIFFLTKRDIHDFQRMKENASVH